jgi:hypothetical protein
MGSIFGSMYFGRMCRVDFRCINYICVVVKQFKHKNIIVFVSDVYLRSFSSGEENFIDDRVIASLLLSRLTIHQLGYMAALCSWWCGVARCRLFLVFDCVPSGQRLFGVEECILGNICSYFVQTLLRTL